MKRGRLTITLRKDLINLIDTYIDGMKIRNRSHAIEFLLMDSLNPAVKKAVILAADQGIKFRPFTYETPKAMLPINGRPLLEHIITRLREHEIRDIYISVGYLSDRIKSYFDNGSKFGVRISYIEQAKKDVGTGGALRNFQKFIGQKEPFFLIYGDVLADINYQDLIHFYYKRQNGLGVVALTTVGRPEFWGVVKLKGDNIVEFQEKPDPKTTKSHLISAGIYLFTPKIFAYIAKNIKISLERQVLPQVLKKEKLRGYLLEGDWYDISTPEIYEEALREWK